MLLGTPRAPRRSSSSCRAPARSTSAYLRRRRGPASCTGCSLNGSCRTCRKSSPRAFSPTSRRFCCACARAPARWVHGTIKCRRRSGRSPARCGAPRKPTQPYPILASPRAASPLVHLRRRARSARAEALLGPARPGRLAPRVAARLPARPAHRHRAALREEQVIESTASAKGSGL